MATDTLPSTAYGAYETLLHLSEQLSDPRTRNDGLEALRVLAKHVSKNNERGPLRHVSINVHINSESQTMQLLLLPSIFEPEEWTNTFLQGSTNLFYIDWTLTLIFSVSDVFSLVK